MVETSTVIARNLGREELISELRALKPAFARAGVTRMTLFGSRARGDNRPDSDVDLIIEVDSERKFSLVELSRVGLVVQDHLGLPASIVMRRSAKPAMLAAADRDGVAVF
ncbi:MAG: nucleotidyltransferase domain-containing protein [Dongiaceae bacterium]